HAAPRRRGGAGRSPGRLPALPTEGRQPVPSPRPRERRRRAARERQRGRRSDGAPRLPVAAAHGAARSPRRRSRRHAAHAPVRAAMRLLALLLALAAPPTVHAADDATVALNFQDVELPVLAKFVSEVTGRNFILDDRVRGKVTIISPTRITPDEAYTVFQS